MQQDEINQMLDDLLEDCIFNEDITADTSGEDIKDIILSVAVQVVITEEQWRYYAAHCLQHTVETVQNKRARVERIQ